MGFDELLQAIGEQACRQRRTILRTAEDEAQAMLDAAHARRADLVQSALAHAETAVRREASRTVSQARLQARREVRAARHEVIEATLRALEQRLVRVIDSAAGPELLGRLLEEGLRDADDPVTVGCRPRDRAAVAQQARRLGRVVTVVEDDALPFGGVNCICGPEGRVTCRNSFADRRERIRPLLLQEAARLLFGPAAGERPA